ncbi:hypothetical protein F5Y14DRAFT_132848 [Nemania sp. NC0429]|nr:hypothetical protein F5Y14DRAFT_132848 [Nemania sp. NC0429]
MIGDRKTHTIVILVYLACCCATSLPASHPTPISLWPVFQVHPSNNPKTIPRRPTATNRDRQRPRLTPVPRYPGARQAEMGQQHHAYLACPSAYKYREDPPLNPATFFRSPSPPQSSRVAKHYKDIYRDIRLFSRIDSGIPPGPVCQLFNSSHTRTLPLPLSTSPHIHFYTHSPSLSSAKPS